MASRRSLPSAVALVLGLLLSAACASDATRGTAELHIQLEPDPAPAVVGSTRLLVRVFSADWTPRNGLRVTVSARGPSGEATGIASGEGAGRYVLPNLPVTRAGRWMVTVRAEARDGRWSEVEVPLEVDP